MNFHGTDPKEWLAIYDPLQASKEPRSFYVPFGADPRVAGRAFIGMEHVWRTDDNGGNPSFLEAHCNALHRDAGPCGDWQPMGNTLTAGSAVNDRGGKYVVAVERSRTDSGTLWAGNARRAGVGDQGGRRGQPAERALLPHRHRGHARTLRVRDRDRPARLQPRVDLVLRLRRVHARDDTARARGALRPEEPHGDASPTARTTSATSR